MQGRVYYNFSFVVFTIQDVLFWYVCSAYGAHVVNLLLSRHARYIG
jgi:hypothetical protein